MANLSLILLLCGLLSLVGTSHAATPTALSWSKATYGPDGPWQAVSVKLGSNEQSVDLYPGDTYASTILMDTICDNKTLSSTCYASSAGTFNANESHTAVSAKPAAWNVATWSVYGDAVQADLGDQMNIGPTLQNISMTATYDAYQKYYDGTPYPVSVGTLSLGAPMLTHTDPTGWTLNMITSALWMNYDIPSYAYGMHIGSVDPKIPGALTLGGYDQSRVVGDVSVQDVSSDPSTSGNLYIKLRDVGIGVATGGTPFNFTSKDGLFGSTRSVQIDPTRPYLYLPLEACDAIAAELPVTFNETLGLYFWNDTNPQYKEIISSAAYLSFNFYGNNTPSLNSTIKVPFQLLNLTLEEPLVDKPTPYFPCYPSHVSQLSLGRAFLQAAFIGANWQNGTGGGIYWIAQAPGPGGPESSNQPINVNDEMIEASTGTWEESWDGWWQPLPSDSSNESSSNGGLSTGAKAGIGVGCAVAGIILITATVCAIMFRRKRNIAQQDAVETCNQDALLTKASSALPLNATNQNIPHNIPSELESENAKKPQDRFELGA